MAFTIRNRDNAPVMRIIMTISVAVAYALIFVPTQTEEIVIAPAWVSERLADAGASAGASAESGDASTGSGSASAGASAESGDAGTGASYPVPFRYNRLFGYISADGVIDAILPIAYDIAYSNTQYSPYDAINYPIPIYDRAKRLRSVIEQYGYPVIDGERVVVFNQNGSTVSEWNAGQELWRRDFGAIVSAIDVGRTLTAVAFFDGAIVALDRRGETIARFAAPPDEDALFSSVAMSENQLLYVTYNPLRQQLLLFRIDAGQVPRADDPNASAAASSSAAATPSVAPSSDTRAASIDALIPSIEPTEIIAVPPPNNGNSSFPYIEFLPDSENFVYFDGAALYLYSATQADAERTRDHQTPLRLLHGGVQLVDIDMNAAYLAAIIRTITHTALHIYSTDGAPVARLQLIDTSRISDHFVRFSSPRALSLLVGIEGAIIAIHQQGQERS